MNNYEIQRNKYIEYVSGIKNPSLEEIKDIISDTNWYFLSESISKSFQSVISEHLEKHFLTISLDDLEKLYSKVQYINLSEPLCLNLLNTSIKERKILFSPYNYNLSQLPPNDIDQYLILLNEYDSPFIENIFYNLAHHSSYKISHLDITTNHYERLFCGKNNQLIKPSAKMNVQAIKSCFNIFIQNDLISLEEKKDIFKNHGTTWNCQLFFKLLKDNTIRFSEFKDIWSNAVEISLEHIENNLLDSSKNKYIKDPLFNELFSLQFNDQNEMFNELMSKHKNRFINILKTKVSQSLLEEASNDKSSCLKLNFLQFLFLKHEHKNILQDHISSDPTLLQLFKQPMIHQINGFDFFTTPLDLSIKNDTDIKHFENIYKKLLIDQKLNHEDQEKFCCFIFKTFTYHSKNTHNDYSDRLHTLTLFTYKTLNRYFNRLKDNLPSNTHSDIEKICLMKSLSSKIAPSKSTDLKIKL